MLNFPTITRLALLISGLLIYFSPQKIQAQQHLQSYQLIGQFSVSDVESILNGFGIPQGLLKVEFPVDVYKVTYQTRNAQDTGNTTATGAIAIPQGISCPLPLASYAHGTVSRRYDVPSYGSQEMNIGVAMAALYGYVATMPDYLGLGDSPGFHPYVHAKSEATACIDLLRSARELKDSLNFNLNDQVFLCGYSQGGHASMATFKELEENYSNEFSVTAAAPMSGPYDVSGVQSQYLTADAPYSTPGYLPYVVLGYQEAYGGIYSNLNQIFKSPYDTLVVDLFDGTNGIGYINSFLPDTPKHMLDTAFLADFISNPNNPARIALADNDLYDWVPNAPLTMYYCTADEQVAYQNAIVTYDTMNNLGALNVSAINGGNQTHGGCVQPSLLGGLNFFNQYRDLLGGMQISFSTTDASASANDGSITIAASNGQANYNFEWLGGNLAGLDTTYVGGLAPGVYTVRVSDDRGCYSYEQITVNTLSNINTYAEEELFKLYPNPANQETFIEIKNFKENLSLECVDMMGRRILSIQNLQEERIRLDLSQLPSGIYFINISDGVVKHTQKLILR
jgi:pimeloyl-ACP methyl ester carboxylesterase